MTKFQTVLMIADFVYETAGPGRGPLFKKDAVITCRDDRAAFLCGNGVAELVSDAPEGALHEADLLPPSYINYDPPADVIERVRPPTTAQRRGGKSSKRTQQEETAKSEPEAQDETVLDRDDAGGRPELVDAGKIPATDAV